LSSSYTKEHLSANHDLSRTGRIWINKGSTKIYAIFSRLAAREILASTGSTTSSGAMHSLNRDNNISGGLHFPDYDELEVLTETFSGSLSSFKNATYAILEHDTHTFPIPKILVSPPREDSIIIPSPPDAFGIYRDEKMGSRRFRTKNGASKHLSLMWKSLSQDVKDQYGYKADVALERYRRDYPDYRAREHKRTLDSALGRDTDLGYILWKLWNLQHPNDQIW
jgi:hypothetical protein